MDAMKSVIKRNGETAEFDVEKLRESLHRAGASRAEIERVVELVTVQMKDGISTHELYKMAYAQLRRKSAKVAGRYRLKKAILELGPTGHPFEYLVGEIFKEKGYQTKVGVLTQGACVSHELDVVAEKDDTRIMVECKFHNDIRRKSDVKVSLYIHSRFLDMKKAWEKTDADRVMRYEGWVVTNTRFTSDALQYGNCSGMKMVSWDYPSGGSLREMVDKAGFHPITTMQSLTKSEKVTLLDQEIILCRTLLQHPEILYKLGKSDKQVQRIFTEAKQISEVV